MHPAMHEGQYCVMMTERRVVMTYLRPAEIPCIALGMWDTTPAVPCAMFT